MIDLELEIENDQSDPTRMVVSITNRDTEKMTVFSTKRKLTVRAMRYFLSDAERLLIVPDNQNEKS